MNQTFQEERFSRLCAFLLDRRRACYLIAIALAVLCCISSEWATVRENPYAVLAESAEARRGLEVMEAEFSDPATGRILVDNIAAPQARELAERLSLAAGVQSVDFDERSGYRTGRALLTVTFRDSDTRTALSELRSLLDGYDFSIMDSPRGSVSGEVWLIVAAVCAAVLTALALLMKTPAVTGTGVVLLTFGAAFLFNSGTWFLSKELSAAAVYMSGLVQFSLCVVCVTPMFRRCLRARARMSTREAVLLAWSRTAPEMFGASVALLCTLAVMGLLHLRIGSFGLTLAKAVALTLLALCALTPGLLLDLCEPLDRTPPREKNASGLAEFAIQTRVLMPLAFVAVLVAANVCVGYFPRVYSTDALPIWFPWGAQRTEAEIRTLFGEDNTLSVLIPASDFSRESELLQELSDMDGVKTARGLANMEAMNGYMLAERLTPRQFAELMNLDMDESRQLYSAYIEQANASRHLAAGLDNAAIPLAEMLPFACDCARDGYVTLDWGQGNELELLRKRTESAREQMGGADHHRLILNLSIPKGSAKTVAFLYTLRSALNRYYPEGTLLVGDAVRDTDLSTAFRHDRILFFALALAIALVALFAATGSVGVSLASALVTQGGVWMTFSLFLLSGQGLYFLTDFFLNAVQMGIGLMFALLLAGTWLERKRDNDTRTALALSLQENSSTLTLCGIVAALAACAAGVVSMNRTVASMAVCMGAGVLLAMFLTLLVLPQTLLLLPDVRGSASPDGGSGEESAEKEAQHEET
ncbi:MAG: MMPL family transporter [Oscillibacter sp.]|nr:MMPL family transporter [Oscillibacter sp.]